MPLPARVQEPALMHVFYLHGFGSSSAVVQGALLRRASGGRSAARCTCPDLNEPDFSTLTTTRMIAAGRRGDGGAAARARSSLIGSSLGAFVAWHTTGRQLGARAVHASDRTAGAARARARLRPRAAWRASARRSCGNGGRPAGASSSTTPTTSRDACTTRSTRTRTLRFGARPMDTCPTLVFQGSRDALVDPAACARSLQARPTIDAAASWTTTISCRASLETLWQRTAAFLGSALLTRARNAVLRAHGCRRSR